MKPTSKTLLISMFFVFITGCGDGFQSTPSSDPGNGAQDTPAPSIEDRWNEVDAGGKVEGNGEFGQHQVLQLDPVHRAIVVSLPVRHNDLFQPFQAPIEELPGASFEFVQLTERKWAMQFTIPAYYVLKKVGFGMAGLPNGEALPYVPGGVLPSLGFSLGSSGLDLFTYFGLGRVAMYLEVPIPLFRFKWNVLNKQDERFGEFHTFPQSEVDGVEYPGGVYLVLRLPSKLADELRQLLDEENWEPDYDRLPPIE